MRAATAIPCLAILAAIVVAASASAQTFQKKPDGAKAPAPKVLAPVGQSRPRPNTTTAPKGKGMAPLTADDCTDLGGTIQINSLCNSRFACSRTDQNGKTHHVCINGK